MSLWSDDEIVDQFDVTRGRQLLRATIARNDTANNGNQPVPIINAALWYRETRFVDHYWPRSVTPFEDIVDSTCHQLLDRFFTPSGTAILPSIEAWHILIVRIFFRFL